MREEDGRKGIGPIINSDRMYCNARVLVLDETWVGLYSHLRCYSNAE